MFFCGYRMHTASVDTYVLWIIWKARKSKKKIKQTNKQKLLLLYFLCQSLCVDENKLWKNLQEMGTPDHLSCLLRNLCAGEEATGRAIHGTTDWFQIRKGVCQGCTLSPCLFNMQNTSWEMPGLVKHKLESRLAEEISTTSDMQMTLPLWQKVKRNWRASRWKWKSRVKKLA